jgi:hypothetical protein
VSYPPSATRLASAFLLVSGPAGGGAARRRPPPRLGQRRPEEHVVGDVDARGAEVARLGGQRLDTLAEHDRLDLAAERGRLAEDAERVLLQLPLVVLEEHQRPHSGRS